MKIAVKVHAKARKNSVEIDSGGQVNVSVTAPATKGKANIAVSKLLAKHFHQPKSKILLVRGEKTRDKIFLIG